jgi:hypothetical protein
MTDSSYFDTNYSFMEVLRKHALAFYICASRLLKTKRDDARIPTLPSYDDQLRVVIVGET